MLPTVSILIVTYNSSAILPACLDSIVAETRLTYEIIVVDNDSQDDTVSMVRTRYPQVSLIKNQRNVGFAVAVNQAAQTAQGRYLLLLNPDTVIQMNAVDRLAAHLDNQPTVGIGAPRLRSGDKHIRHNTFVFETPWSFFWFGVGVGPLRRVRRSVLPHAGWSINANQVQLVDAVTGAAMLIRQSLFEQLGGLDERFFMYCEDGDFCLRARLAGKTTILLPDAVVTHYGGASTPESAIRLNGMIGRHLLNSRYQYTRKYWGYTATIALRFAYGLAGLAFMTLSLLLTVRQGRTRIFKHGKLLWATPLPCLEHTL